MLRASIVGLVSLFVMACSEREGTATHTQTQAASPPTPPTCESAGDRYIELYKQEARSSGMGDRADDTARLERKRSSFVEQCKTQVASGVMKPEHLACAMRASTISAANACFPRP